MKKRIKKISVVLVAVLLAALLSMPALAGGTAKLVTAASCSELAVGGTFELTLTLDGVEYEEGVALVDYTVRFNPELFELVDDKMEYPDDWGGEAEVFNVTKEPGVFNHTCMNSELGYGAQNGEIKGTLTFRALAEGANGATITVSDITIYRDDRALTEISDGSVLSIKIEFGKDISAEVSEAASAVAESSSFFDVPSGIAGESDNASIPDAAESSAVTEESGEISNPESTDDGSLLYIIIIVLVVAAAVVSVVIILAEKKKQKHNGDA